VYLTQKTTVRTIDSERLPRHCNRAFSSTCLYWAAAAAGLFTSGVERVGSMEYTVSWPTSRTRTQCQQVAGCFDMLSVWTKLKGAFTLHWLNRSGRCGCGPCPLQFSSVSAMWTRVELQKPSVRALQALCWNSTFAHTHNRQTYQLSPPRAASCVNVIIAAPRPPLIYCTPDFSVGWKMQPARLTSAWKWVQSNNSQLRRRCAK